MKVKTPQNIFSKRELQVFKLLITENLSREIAIDLNLNEKTISTFKLRILKKAGCKTIIGLYRYNITHKLFEIDLL